jgi:alkylated DNA repair protein (DNA oxidative demethylase)
VCIMNLYQADSRMGVHQDKDERPETIATGAPIVSVSLGDTARFVIGGLTRKEPTRPLMLHSGDVVVMGGASRLRFHGVTRTVPGTAPEGTGPGRFNLTFRQW